MTEQEKKRSEREKRSEGQRRKKKKKKKADALLVMTLKRDGEPTTSPPNTDRRCRRVNHRPRRLRPFVRGRIFTSFPCRVCLKKSRIPLLISLSSALLYNTTYIYRAYIHLWHSRPQTGQLA